jgi:hypothetical protein
MSWGSDGFPFLPDEERKFRPAIDKSWAAPWVVGQYLHSGGNLSVFIGAKRYREAGADPRTYGDNQDLSVLKWGLDRWWKAEVKHRQKLLFTCAQDCRHSSLFIDRIEKADRADIDAYYSVNQPMTHAAVFRTSTTREHWRPKKVFDTEKGYWIDVYECPVEYAEFIPLL